MKYTLFSQSHVIDQSDYSILCFHSPDPELVEAPADLLNEVSFHKLLSGDLKGKIEREREREREREMLTSCIITV